MSETPKVVKELCRWQLQNKTPTAERKDERYKGHVAAIASNAREEEKVYLDEAKVGTGIPVVEYIEVHLLQFN